MEDFITHDKPAETAVCSSPTCARAGQQLPFSEFYFNRTREPEVRFARCKRCTCLASAENKKTPGKAHRHQRQREIKAEFLGTVDLGRAAELAAQQPLVHPIHLRRFSLAKRIVISLAQHGPQTYKDLARNCRIHKDDLGDVLTGLIGNVVASRNGTGPRNYFINRAYQPPKSEAEQRAITKQRAAVPPLSFSSLSLPTTPVVRSELLKPASADAAQPKKGSA